MGGPRTALVAAGVAVVVGAVGYGVGTLRARPPEPPPPAPTTTALHAASPVAPQDPAQARRTRLAQLPWEQVVTLDDADVQEAARLRLAALEAQGALAHLSRPARDLQLLLALEDALAEGGFEAYFASPRGDGAKATLAALRALGEPGLPGVFEQALAVFPYGRPEATVEARRAQLAALEPAQREFWEGLERQFTVLRPRLERARLRTLRAQGAALALPAVPAAP